MQTAGLSALRGVGRYAGRSLTLTTFSHADNGEVIEGVLRPEQSNTWYPIVDGVPCFLIGMLRPDLRDFAMRHQLNSPEEEPSRPEGLEQAKTTASFSNKWQRFSRYGFEQEPQKFLLDWYCKKFGVSDLAALKNIYSDCKRVLEVGPGSGFNTRFIASVCRGEVFALDISDAAFVAHENTRDLANCTVVQADLMDAPFPDETFDMIVADGVLHHTPNTRLALHALNAKLAPGGKCFFYVYKRMGPARQFCDQMIRNAFGRLSIEECFKACEGLTELGRELSRLNAKITLQKDIPVLAISAGTHDVQRLIYYNFVKCFWNDAFDFETNNMINFDWYHPHTAWQHTEDEVRSWLAELHVTDFAINDANPNGISVVMRKPSR